MPASVVDLFCGIGGLTKGRARSEKANIYASRKLSTLT